MWCSFFLSLSFQTYPTHIFGKCNQAHSITGWFALLLRSHLFLLSLAIRLIKFIRNKMVVNTIIYSMNAIRNIQRTHSHTYGGGIKKKGRICGWSTKSLNQKNKKWNIFTPWCSIEMDMNTLHLRYLRSFDIFVCVFWTWKKEERNRIEWNEHRCWAPPRLYAPWTHKWNIY